MDLYSALQTSDFKHWFRALLIANIAFAKLANISGTYSVKAIQTKVKNDKNDLDCKCRLLEYDVIYIHYTAISIKVVPKQSAKAGKSNTSAKGSLGIAKKLMIFFQNNKQIIIKINLINLK